MLQFCGAQLIVFVFCVLVASLLQKAGLTAFQSPDGFGAVVLGTLGFQGVTLVLAPLFLRQHQMNWRDAFGLREPHWGRWLFPAGLLTLVLLPVILGLQIISAELLVRAGWSPRPQLAVTLLADSNSWCLRLYLGLFAVGLAPVAEEFLFRAMLYPFLKRLGYPRLAWIGVSLLFALVHDDATTFVPLFVLALALTWLYEMTGNLLAPIAAHALFNAANLVLLLSLGDSAAHLPSAHE